MSELTWSATRTDAIDRFQGQTPRPDDEAAIIDVFEQHPQLVLRAIDETATALTAGKITWAWAIVKTRLERGTTAIREATADTSNERTRRILNAHKWITNAGIHFDRIEDVEAELFGDDLSRGRLHDYDTPELRQEMLDDWRAQRPRGVKAKEDFEAWNAKCKADRAIVVDDFPF